MRWRDVSLPLKPGMLVYTGDPAVSIEQVAAIARGDVCNLSRATMGLHSGTHVDAPLHFIEGAGGVETLPAEAFLGPAFVVDASGASGHIDARVLESLDIPRDCERLLFRTANSMLWRGAQFSPEYTALTEDAARALVVRGVRLVGIDYLSIAPFGDPAPTHRALLEAGVVVLEGLDLRDIEPGPYELACLPLLIPGADGAPARALLGRPQ